VILTTDARGQNVAVRPDLSTGLVTTAVKALIEHIAARRSRDIVVETINGQSAATSAQSPAFVAAGLRLTTAGLRYYASFSRG
jgi:hypothetical protein